MQQKCISFEWIYFSYRLCNVELINWKDDDDDDDDDDDYDDDYDDVVAFLMRIEYLTWKAKRL